VLHITRELAGTTIATWHNVELPETNARLDLLGESAAGELVHIELQSTNDPTIARRMAEYYLKIDHRFARFATQVVLYVGTGAVNDGGGVPQSEDETVLPCGRRSGTGRRQPAPESVDRR